VVAEIELAWGHLMRVLGYERAAAPREQPEGKPASPAKLR